MRLGVECIYRNAHKSRFFALSAATMMVAYTWSAGVPGYGALKLEEWERQPVLPVPLTTNAPVIDGQIDLAEWRHATQQTAFIDQNTGVLDELGTELRLMYDAEALYIAVRVRRPDFLQYPKADFPKGRHADIWWKDDNFELVIIPGPRQQVRNAYIFVGNGKGGYSEMVKPLGAEPPPQWSGAWEYAARWRILGDTRVYHWPVWEAELKIPFKHFPGCRPPQAGEQWELGFMNQTLTPLKKRVTWSQEWSFGNFGYTSPTLGRLRFMGGSVGVSQRRRGRIDADRLGNEFILFNTSKEPVELTVKTLLYKSESRRPETSESFFDLWDMVRFMDTTGEKMLQDPRMAVQAFRSRADLVKELNERYLFIKEQQHTKKVVQGANNYSLAVTPTQQGEYLCLTEMRDKATGEIAYSHIFPFAYFEGFDMRVFPYFLRHKKVRVELDTSRFVHKDKPGSVRVSLLDKSGRELSSAQRQLVVSDSKVNLYLDTAALAHGTTGSVQAALLDHSGTEQHRESVDLPRPPNPEWYGNNIGKSPVICPPFQPLEKRDANTIKLWRRTYTLGGWGLPSSIVARDTELLGAPVSLRIATVDGREWDEPGVQRLRSTAFTERQARWSTVMERDGVRVAMETTLAYDGMLRYDLTLEPLTTLVEMTTLALRIPVRQQWSRFFGHHATGTRLDSHKMECKGGGVERWFGEYTNAMPFTCAMMLCGEDRGIQWFCASDREWANNDPAKTIRLERGSDNGITLVVPMIERTKTIAKKTTYTFGMIATPVREVNRDTTVESVSGGGPLSMLEATNSVMRQAVTDSWQLAASLGMSTIGDYIRRGSHLFGVPRFYTQSEEHEFAEALRAMHESGLKYVPYANWGVNTGLPFFQSFGYEMLMEPLKDISYGSFAQYMGSSFPDWYLHTLKHSRDSLGINGNYMDATQIPRLCANALDDMGWQDEDGHTHGTYDIWEQREFAERLYTFWHHETRPRGLIGTHTSNIPLYFITCFSDYVPSGEYHLPGNTLEEQCPLDTWLMFYCTWPHGCNTTRLWWNWYKKPLLRNHVWTMAGLHDVKIPTGLGNLRLYHKTASYDAKAKPYMRIRTVRRAFNDSHFDPYWSQRSVTFEPAGPLASLWINEERKAVYVFVANIPDAPYSGSMSINPTLLPRDMELEVYDAMLDQPLGTLATPLPLKIEPMRYRMLTIGIRIAQ